jgi:hypothetical protein
MIETIATNATISIDENTQYADLMNKIYPFTKSTNKIEKKAAYDINYLLFFAINQRANPVLFELKQGIENAINYFTKEINDLINQTVLWENDTFYANYDFLNDIVRVITQTLLHKTKLTELNNFLLGIK